MAFSCTTGKSISHEVSVSTAHTMSDVRVEPSFGPGVVERRMVAFPFDLIKRKLYDMGSMRMGRDSQEAQAFKASVLDIIREVKRQGYDLIDSDLEVSDSGVLGQQEIVDIIKYLAPEDQQTGIFYTRLRDLVSFAFRDEAARSYVYNYIGRYTRSILRRLEQDFNGEWAGAVAHLLRQRSRDQHEED